MSDLWTGTFLGFGVAMLITAGLTIWAYRRFVVLERRARRAERLAELGSLTGGLAHEIKNPLSTIQLNLQLLQEDLPSETVVGSRVHSRLRTVRQEASRLREILDDFLKYAGRLELECEVTDVGVMVEELSDFFFPQASSQQVRLRYERPAESVKAKLDPRLMKQAVLNLMLNATQAMTGGGELILKVEQVDGQAEITITDTGPGISPELQDQIFQAYYTTKKGGTGLGLPMTRRIAEEHGGTIRLESEMGKGSKFTLSVPSKGPRD